MAAEPYEIVRILLPDETHPLPDARRARLRSQIAECCEVAPAEVQIPKHKKDGLWVCLDVPAGVAFDLIDRFDHKRETLHPLFDEFEVGQINQLQIDYDNDQFTDLTQDILSLIRLLYPSAECLELEQQVAVDGNGGVAILARCLHGHGKPFVRQIIRINSAVVKSQAGWGKQQIVEHNLPLIAPRVDSVIEWRGWTATNYRYVGGGMFGSTRTLAALYRDPEVTTEGVIAVLDRMLGDELGYHWYARSKPYGCTVAEAYSPELIEHLRVRVRPDSADAVWQPQGTTPHIAGYERLVGDTILTTYHQVEAGQLVQINGLNVTAVSPGELTLQHPIDPGIVIKVEGQRPAALAVGEQTVVRGEIVYNRRRRMAEIAEQIFTDAPGIDVDITRYQLAFHDRSDTYPNPLYFYTKLLDRPLPGGKSTVYGQMRADTVLVDQSLRGWMTDLEPVREQHNIYDMVMLETSLRQQLVNWKGEPFSPAEYIDFEERLAASALGLSTTMPKNPGLQRAYQAIDSLRRLAARFMEPPANFRAEYFPVLFFMNLAVLKDYGILDDVIVRQAFVTAAVLGRYISHQGDTPSYFFESRLLRQRL